MYSIITLNIRNRIAKINYLLCLIDDKDDDTSDNQDTRNGGRGRRDDNDDSNNVSRWKRAKK